MIYHFCPNCKKETGISFDVDEEELEYDAYCSECIKQYPDLKREEIVRLFQDSISPVGEDNVEEI